jgi:hypothetical protein
MFQRKRPMGGVCPLDTTGAGAFKSLWHDGDSRTTRLPRSERGLRFFMAPLHCGTMRTTRQLAWTIVLVVVLGHRLACAQLSSNDIVAATKDADACILRLQEIRDEAVKLEEGAPADQVELVDCVHSRVLEIKGLLGLSLSAQRNLRRVIKTDKAETVDGYAANVKLCCERAEKLLLEAEGCATSVTLKTPTPTNEAPTVVTNSSVDIKITPRGAGLPPVRRTVVRTKETCLHQEQFATMLARAMDLKMTDKATADDFMKRLAKLAVEPLHGWQPGQCVTVDDVYVACARAMNLKVKDPRDPLSYGQALRDEGLGVDTLLPERDPQLDPPYVLESEVRALLTTGYAAPLPSSRRVAPD